MNRYPHPDAETRTGSNLRGDPLRAFRQAALDRDRALHEKLARTHHRLTRKLFTRPDIRRAGDLHAAIEREWREASVQVGGDVARLAALQVASRRKLERMLGRGLPGYREWKALQRTHMREHQKLAAGQAALLGPRAGLHWGELPPLAPIAQVFTPPYTSFDVHTTCTGDFIVADHSFARPPIGHLVNNIVYDQDEHTSFSSGLWGLLSIESATNQAACGVAYTTPAEGRLRIGAELRNFYNKVAYSVSDNFGFSSADVGFTLSLFVAVVRGTDVTRMSTELISGGLVSHGSGMSFAQSDLDDTVPYSITAITDTRFDANESVLVLAGSEVAIGTRLDDMHAKVSAVLWWQLDKLVIDVAPDVIT